MLHTLLGDPVFTKRPASGSVKAHVRWHRSASTPFTRAVYTVTTYMCKCTRMIICRCPQRHTNVPKRPTLSEPPPVHTSPRLALPPPSPRLPSRKFSSSPLQGRSSWTHFELSPRHAPSATGPASVSFPLEKMAVTPLVSAPPAADSPIAGQEGGAGPPPQRERPRYPLRPESLFGRSRARAIHVCTPLQSARPPASWRLRCALQRLSRIWLGRCAELSCILQSGEKTNCMLILRF